MRPAGEISVAILAAAERLAWQEQGERHGATLQELAKSACVGMQAARDTVANLRRHGKLEQVAERRVSYRNRPVVEYAKPRHPMQDDEDQEPAYIDVATIFTSWAHG